MINSEQSTWYTISELVGMPGLPATNRGIKKMADRENWESQPNNSRGGGRKYHIDSLPPETRAQIYDGTLASFSEQSKGDSTLDEMMARCAADAEGELAKREAIRQAKTSGLRDWSALPDGPKKQKAKARKWLLDCLNQYRRENSGTAAATLFDFVEQFNRGNGVTPPEWITPLLPQYGGAKKLTTGTLRRWESQFNSRGIMALAPSVGEHRRGCTIIDNNSLLKEVVLGCLVDRPHITSNKILQYIEAEYNDLPRPSNRSLQRWLKCWKSDNAQLWTYVTNPDKWKNIYMSAVGSHHAHIERLNQLWEMDSTPGDVMLTDGRHSVVGIIDMYSRRLKYFVSKTSTAAAVCQVFRRAALAWGVPEAVRTDNGADYVSERFCQAIEALEIGHEVCIPFASEEKGTIERSMRTMSHGITDLLPGFVGHNVGERKEIEARRAFSDRIMTKGEIVEVSLSADEFQEKLDQWTDHIYMHDAHSGEGMSGKTPFQKASEWAGEIHTIEDERVLDLLLAPLAGTKTIGKKGIRHQNHYYYSADLFQYDGEVQVKLDEGDIGRLAVYQDGAFLCWVECPAITGNSHEEAAAAVKHSQKKLMAVQAKELKSNKKAVRKDIHTAIVDYRIDQSKTLTHFPHKSVPHTSAGLTAAADAAKARMPLTSSEQTTEQKAAHARLVESISNPTPVAEILDTPQKRYSKAHSLEQRLVAAGVVSEKDQQWLAIYQTGAEYSGQKRFNKMFGLQDVNAGQ